MARILVVEDEPDIALGLQLDLRDEGHEVEVARDGVEASRRGREPGWDLILLDIMLPLEDGFEVCRDLRRAKVRTPVLMLTARAQEAAMKALEAAHQTATLEGDLEGAIAQYERIIRTYIEDPAAVAIAIQRIAEAYELLGSPEAIRAYRRLASDFADQPAAAVARGRLASLEKTRNSAALTARRVLATTDDLSGAFLVDGRYLAFADDVSDGPAVRDLETGRVTRLTKRSATNTAAITAILSPDRTTVAYSWTNLNHYELRVVANRTGAPVRTLRSTQSLESYYVPKAWWPDSRSLLVERRNPDGTWQFLRVHIGDGSADLLHSLEWRRPPLPGFRRVSLSPDGRFLVYSALTANPVRSSEGPGTPGDERISLLATDGSGQTELTRVAGNNLNPIWTADGSHVVFLSDRTGVFDLWAVAVRNGKPLGSAFVVKRDIGRVTPMGMSGSGTFRYLTGPQAISQVSFSRLDRGAGPLGPVPEPLVGTSPAWSPDGEAVAVFRPTPGRAGASDLVVRSMRTGEEQRIPLAARPDRARPIWAPDCRSLVISLVHQQGFQSLHRVRLRERDTAEISSLGRFVLGGGMRAALAPDGRTLYVGGNLAGTWEDVKLDRIVAVDLESGGQREVVSVPSATYVGDLALSPDGSTLAFMIWDEQVSDKSLALVRTDGTGYRVIATALGPEASASKTLWWDPDGRSVIVPLPKGAAGDHLVGIRVAGGAVEPTTVFLPRGGVADLDPRRTRIAVATSTTTYELWEMENVAAALQAGR